MQPMATTADVYGPTTGLTWDNTYAIGGDTVAATTSSTSNAGISASTSDAPMQQFQLLPALQGINPLVGALVIVLVLVGIKALHEWKRAESDFAEIKIGLISTVTVTVMAAAGLPLLKAILARYRIPGVSDYVVGGLS